MEKIIIINIIFLHELDPVMLTELYSIQLKNQYHETKLILSEIESMLSKIDTPQDAMAPAFDTKYLKYKAKYLALKKKMSL